MLHKQTNSPRELNVTPEKWWLEDYIPFGILVTLQVLCFQTFWCVTYSNWVVATQMLFICRTIWGNDPIWLIFFKYFQMGWFNHQLDKCCKTWMSSFSWNSFHHLLVGRNSRGLVLFPPETLPFRQKNPPNTKPTTNIWHGLCLEDGFPGRIRRIRGFS